MPALAIVPALATVPAEPTVPALATVAMLPTVPKLPAAAPGPDALNGLARIDTPAGIALPRGRRRRSAPGPDGLRREAPATVLPAPPPAYAAALTCTDDLRRRRVQLDLQGRVVGGLVALAVGVVDVAARDERRQVLAREREVDAQAVVARVVAFALLPAGVAVLLGVQAAVDVDELALGEDLGDAATLGLAGVVAALQPAGLVDVLVGRRDVEVAGDQTRARLRRRGGGRSPRGTRAWSVRSLRPATPPARTRS